MSIKLKYQGSDNQQGVIELGPSSLIIGRGGKCDVQISDETLSSKHLAVKVNQSSKVIIKDLGSTNGTMLNNNIINESVCMLGDKIQIGDVILTISEESLTIPERQALTPRKSENKNHNQPLSLPEPSLGKETQKKSLPKTVDLALGEISELEAPKKLKAKKEESTLHHESNQKDGEINATTPPKSAPQEKIRQRILEKSSQIQNVRKKLLDDGINEERGIDLGAPTGGTRFIKLDNIKPQIKPRVKEREKVELDDKKESFLFKIISRIINLFKKKES